MHTSSLTAAPQMETSLESKFSAAFEQQISTSGLLGTNNNHHHHHSSKSSQMCNGSKSSKVGHQHHHHHHHHHQPHPQHPSHPPHHHQQHHHPQLQQPTTVPPLSLTTATPSTESTSGEKTVSFRKGNDLESFESLSSLFANGLFTDLVICCPGKMFKCHRVVMAAASLYIRDALSSFYNNNNGENEPGGSAGAGGGGGGGGGHGGTGACNNCNTVLILPSEIKMTDMEAILRFIYDGHVEVKVENIESFLRSARRLNINGLSNVNIVFNNNGTTTTTDDSVNNNDNGNNNSIEVTTAPANNRDTSKNNGYVTKNNNNANNSNNPHPHPLVNNNSNNNLLNGHAGMNSPPPSPPSSSSLNSSLASLKAMTANQAHHNTLPNGNHLPQPTTATSHHHNLASKFLNGSVASQLINQFRHNFQKRDHPPLRNESSILGGIVGGVGAPSGIGSTLGGANIIPAHQNSTPKSIFNNGGLFNSNANSSNSNSTSMRFEPTNPSITSTGGVSRRKQKFPTNIPFLPEMLPPSTTAQALFNTWLSIGGGAGSEEDEEDDLDDNDDDKRLIIKDDSSNDCGSTIGDNMSTTSMDSKQPPLPFGGIIPSFGPQMPCMIEVEADPTNFSSYSDYNEPPPTSSLPPSTQTKRRRNFKSPFGGENRRGGEGSSEKRMKMQQPFANVSTASNNSLDVSIKPTSPLMLTSTSQQSSPSDLPLPLPGKKQSNKDGSGGGGSNSSVRSSSLPAMEKPLFTAYSTMKTAAGANPAGSSPSSSSSASASGSWVGSKWKCDICNKYYGNKQTLKEHIDYFHSNREEQIYICNICNKEYTWRKSLMKHYRDIHQMRNTPALAEINRQLAALATAKRAAAGLMPPGSTTPTGGSDSNPLPAYVSLANYPTPRKSNSKGSSDNSEKSNKSESEMENDNTNDAVPDEEDYGNDDLEIDGSFTTDADMHDDMNDDIKSDSTSPEKIPLPMMNPLTQSLSAPSTPNPKIINNNSNENDLSISKSNGDDEIENPHPAPPPPPPHHHHHHHFHQQQQNDEDNLTNNNNMNNTVDSDVDDHSDVGVGSGIGEDEEDDIGPATIMDQQQELQPQPLALLPPPPQASAHSPTSSHASC